MTRNGIIITTSSIAADDTTEETLLKPLEFQDIVSEREKECDRHLTRSLELRPNVNAPVTREEHASTMIEVCSDIDCSGSSMLR